MRPEADRPSHGARKMGQADTMPQTATIEEGERKPETATKRRNIPKEYAKPTERLMAAAALIGAGMTAEQAAIQLGYSPKSINGINQRIKEKGLDKFITEKRVKTATGVIDKFMKGQPVGRKTEIQVVVEDGEEVRKTIILEPGISPKDSTIKDCAMSVLDRAFPKQQDEGGKGNISFTQVNISLASTVPDPAAISNAPIDVTPISE